MRLTFLTMIGLASFLLIGCERQPSINQPTENTNVEVSTSPVQTGESDTIKSGSFVKAEHATAGSARIITENGKRYLELDQNFQTDRGPDLFVILHRSDTVPNSGLKQQDYVNLGSLQNVNGTQRYAIPDNVNPANFRAAAIWCRLFNVTFGYATLNS